ncbi:uncharacterized protein LOC122515185 [Polistes fuscatus]|uniref:Late endosomal/lysosomal adaptor and MAPK and MTOR activator 5 n=1 Tax=Polistes dominula TaxID=743375 RepID=A0ABM1I622_POLDO|nr:PREDICTED: uncharacterized protein LOC106792799 isoform X1 [Polistes canadensis]XP_015175659.1 PREDICTED: uncharacterized protein LOC107065992 [Polistes dominula]XP_043488363.1 uncharacterized protein LOC122515185 [Polistes fuscatus]KAI4477417.1 hypothetical protein M0804_012803 [Polistes exclamans]
MEKNIEKTLDEVKNNETTIGCILVDRAGLCLGVKGNASSDSAGIIAAIADQAAKLEFSSTFPIVTIQNDNRKCLIQRQGPVVGAIYKHVAS